MSRLALMGAGSTGPGAAGGGGGFTGPASIAGLQAWYKADAGTSTTVDGAAVSQWNDQSGNALNATQATGAAQPLYRAAFQNGLPVLDFSGANRFMAATGVSVAQPDTIFVVAKNLSAAGGVANSVFDGATARQNIYREQTTDKLRVFAGTDIASSAVWGNTTFHQLSLVANGASSALWVDAAAATLGNIGANALTSLILGSNQPANTFWNGYIAEWLIYSSSLSTTDRQNVEGYLKTKWATP